MYIFGGKDYDNNKLNDLWRFDLQTYQWKHIDPAQGSHDIPLERSGHSCDVFGNYMVLFGGIFEITKELNDFMLYDFKQNKWITLFEESVSPKKIMHESSFDDGGNSPFDRASKKSNSPLSKGKS